MTANPRNPAQQKAVESASIAIETLDKLNNDENFRRFMARFTERANQLALDILHGEMTPEKREELRNRRMGIMEVLLAPKQDREAQVRVLAQYGIIIGDANH